MCILKLLCVSKVLGWCLKSKGKTFPLSSPQIWSPISNFTAILIPLLAPAGPSAGCQGIHSGTLPLIVSGEGCLKCHRVLEGSRSCHPALQCLPPSQPGVVRPDTPSRDQPRAHGRAELLSPFCLGGDFGPSLQYLTSTGRAWFTQHPTTAGPLSLPLCWAAGGYSASTSRCLAAPRANMTINAAPFMTVITWRWLVLRFSGASCTRGTALYGGACSWSCTRQHGCKVVCFWACGRGTGGEPEPG